MSTIIELTQFLKQKFEAVYRMILPVVFGVIQTLLMNIDFYLNYLKEILFYNQKLIENENVLITGGGQFLGIYQF
jgi:hypothetical protein